VVYHDGLNAFFLADEHRPLARHFVRPAGSLDRFVHAASVRAYQKKVERLEKRLARASRKTKGAKLMRSKRQATIK
jgi:hypothetical protein